MKIYKSKYRKYRIVSRGNRFSFEHKLRRWSWFKTWNVATLCDTYMQANNLMQTELMLDKLVENNIEWSDMTDAANKYRALIYVS